MPDATPARAGGSSIQTGLGYCVRWSFAGGRGDVTTGLVQAPDARRDGCGYGLGAGADAAGDHRDVDALVAQAVDHALNVERHVEHDQVGALAVAQGVQGLVDVVGVVILLAALLWVVMRSRSKGKSTSSRKTEQATREQYQDEEGRRREGTDDL